MLTLVCKVVKVKSGAICFVCLLLLLLSYQDHTSSLHSTPLTLGIHTFQHKTETHFLHQVIILHYITLLSTVLKSH